MPYIECRIQSGLSAARKQQLALELAKAVQDTIGAPVRYTHVAVTETPSNEFVEAGRVDLPYDPVG